MAEALDVALDRVRSAVLDDGALLRAVASGRRRGAQPAWRRVELRYVDLKAGRRLQITSYDERQAHTRNVAAGSEASAAVSELLRQPFGNWHVDTVTETMQLRVTKKGDALVHTRAATADGAGRGAEPVRQHDRPKPRLLDPGEPVLHLIGISDHQGRVKPTRQAKYRQVEEFLRSLDGALEAATAAGTLAAPTPDRPLRLVDLGCGNAYLTFAAFGYLTGTRGLPTRMVGIDVRPQSLERNTQLAAELGWSDRLNFVQGSIADAEPTFASTVPTDHPVAETAAEVSSTPDVVLALHACDTATDEALARAVTWRAPVVLAAPCCHHDLQTQLRGQPAPPPFGLVMRHGILGERMADLLTDTARAALLRQRGYRVDVLQFVEARDTPRNVLLRAVRTDAPPAPEVQAEYDELVKTWQVRPALERMLGQAAPTAVPA